MRVLQLNVTFGVGSTGRIVQDIHNFLLRKKIESFVIYGRNRYAEDPFAFYIGSKVSFYIDALLTRITGFVGYFSYFYTIMIIRKIKSLQPDIIHLHNIHGYYLNIPMLLRFLITYDKKVVWTLHDEFMYTGKCAYTQECSKYLSTCQQCPLVKEYPKSFLFDWTRAMFLHKKRLLSNISHISFVTPSNWLASRTRGSIIKSHSISVINNGINTKVFKKTPSSQLDKFVNDDDVTVLALIANLDDNNKGHHWIKSMADYIREKNNNGQIHFIVVGSGKTKYNHELIKYIDRTNNVVDLVKLYNSADFYLILSEFENYPTVCLEASAINLPIIGFDVGGVRESIANVPYKLFPHGDESLIKFVSLLKKNNLKNFESPNIKNIDYTTMTLEYLRLYRGLL